MGILLVVVEKNFCLLGQNEGQFVFGFQGAQHAEVDAHTIDGGLAVVGGSQPGSDGPRFVGVLFFPGLLAVHVVVQGGLGHVSGVDFQAQFEPALGESVTSNSI